MKTLKDIQEEIYSNLFNAKNLSESDEDLKKKEKIRNHVSFLKSIKLYLESNPREDFVIHEIERLTNLLKNIEADFKEYSNNEENKRRSLNDLKKDFFKERPVSYYKKHLKNLKYLLK